jgi:hypothetical protein
VLFVIALTLRTPAGQGDKHETQIFVLGQTCDTKLHGSGPIELEGFSQGVIHRSIAALLLRAGAGTWDLS